MMKALPIGIQTFRDIIEGDYVYVDKTRYLYELIQRSKGVYFLSRPRRFGKSLLLSTLQEIFLGNRDLFQTLWLYDSPYQWKTYPIIRIDFSLEQVESAAALQETLSAYLGEIADKYGVELGNGGYQRQFRQLIRLLAEQNHDDKKVVILIDEYDKPILDNIDNSALATEIRDILKGFHTVIKAMDEYTRFVILTGVSKFSRVGVFSGLNNLQDLTTDPRFATALGITEAEIDRDLAGYVDAYVAKKGGTTQELRAEIRRWYDGFCFAQESERVYNPFSLLLFFEKQYFSNYWFESGTPAFLIKLIKERNYDLSQLRNLQVEELAFSTYEIESLSIVPLLFQTGYLTIKAYDPKTMRYTLDYPNHEVENAFTTWLLSAFSHIENAFTSSALWQIVEALQTADLPRFFDLLQTFFAQIPYNIHVKHERYYQSVFYLLFSLIGLRIDAEVTTNTGRIDVVIQLPDRIYLFEFKLDGSQEAALAQIKQNEYFVRYRNMGKVLQLVGVNFDSEKRQVVGWQVESI